MADGSGFDNLNAAQRVVIRAWMDGDNQVKAAEKAGVAQSTVSCWWQRGHKVRDEYERQCAEVHSEIQRQMVASASRGTAAVLKMIDTMAEEFEDAVLLDREGNQVPDADLKRRILDTTTKTVQQLWDRTGHPKSEVPWDHTEDNPDAGDAPDLATHEGREKMAEMLSTLPPEVLEEARKRQRSE